MKQKIKQLAEKIDAMSLRERSFIFLASALIIIAVVNVSLIDPQFAKQKLMAQKIQQEQSKIAEIQTQIQQKIAAGSIDPDVAQHARLKNLRQQSIDTKNGLVDMQKGLISPDKMATVLEEILKRNGRLRLTSLKTLPVASLNNTPVATEKTGATAPAIATDKNAVSPVEGAIYKHGVEVTVQGEYLDMLNYMAALEAMPWQLFWGKANLSVVEYPKATLRLTLFTLSLDKKWLNL